VFKYIADVPEGMVSRQVPEQTYAVFPCTLETIHEMYQYAFQTWLPQSDYQAGDGPDFELYDEDFRSIGVRRQFRRQQIGRKARQVSVAFDGQALCHPPVGVQADQGHRNQYDGGGNKRPGDDFIAQALPPEHF